MADNPRHSHQRSKRWYIFLIGIVFIATGLGLFSALIERPSYRSAAELFVSTTDPSAATTPEQVYYGGLFAQQRVESYARVVTSPAVLQPVIDQLGLQTSVAALSARVHVVAPANTVLLEISASDGNRVLAQRIVAAIVSKFVPLAQTIDPATDPAAAESVIHITVTEPATAAVRTSDLVTRGVLGLAAGLAIAVVVILVLDPSGARVAREE